MPTAVRLTRLFAALLPAVSLALLAGCSAGWKAPLETRGEGAAHSRGSESQPRRAIRAQTYKVRRGDTLYSIAWRSGRDFRSLAGWNGIRPPYTIYVGQVLRLSPPGRSAGHSPRPPPPKVTESAQPKSTTRAPSGNAPEGQRSDASLRWRWPVQGPLLARYSAKDATRKGVKIGGKAGEPVYAAEAGRVVYSGSGLIGYGQLIIIKHNDNYLTAYGHNAKLRVKEGELVARGSHIADMGRSNDGKPMLHFEMRREGNPVDPLALLPRR